MMINSISPEKSCLKRFSRVSPMAHASLKLRMTTETAFGKGFMSDAILRFGRLTRVVR